MSQRAIREIDAKKLRSQSTWRPYEWYLVSQESDLLWLSALLEASSTDSWVVKPDQLFGKRGKYGLVWVNLDPAWVVARIEEKRLQEREIDTTKWTLDTFIVEPFVPHDQEYYIALKTEQDEDIIYFSLEWGVEVEENWEKVIECKVWVLDQISDEQLTTLTWWISKDHLSLVQDFISDMLTFFRQKWFSYLEVNPFVITSDTVICLDMVARVDTCEAWKQPDRKQIERVKPFWAETHPLEEKIEEMDAETGASLKFSTMNPRWRIWLLLWWWWASVAAMDKLADMWLIDEVINYGELSGNPTYRHNKAYIQWLVDLMVDEKETTPWKKRLCVIWGISNFTRIDVFCKAFVDAVSEKVEAIKQAKITIFVRRGGVNDTKGLAMIKTFCDAHEIPCTVADGDVYITDAMEVLR